MNCIEISYLGAACGKNIYEPREKILLLLLCRKYKGLYKNILFSNGAFKLMDKSVKTFDKELKRVYSSVKSSINSPKDFCRIKEEVTKKIKTENKDITPEDLNHISDVLENSLKKDCGINNERKIIDNKKYVKGNNNLYTYNENNWILRGYHDAMHGETVIEIKTRMRYNTVRKNEYDLYQLFGYMLAMNKTTGKIVQYFDNIVYDSDLETLNEYGLVDIKIEPWKTKFEIFKQDIRQFFAELDFYSDKTFDISTVINDSDKPIALFDIDGIANNVNPKYEKIVSALS